MSKRSSGIRRILTLIFIGVFLSSVCSTEVWAQDADTTGTDTESAEAGDSTATDAGDSAAASDEAAAGGAEGIPTSDEAIASGQELFENNCTVCHAVDAQVVGPALKGVTERRPLPWLLSFIKNSQKVIQSGDDYAVNLYNEYNKTQMPSFAFSDEQITNILAYVQAKSNEAPAGGGTGPQGPGEEQITNDQPTVASEYLVAIFIGLLIVLVLILFVLVLIINILTRYLNDREGLDEDDHEVINQRFDAKKLVTSKGFIGIVVFLFAAIALKGAVDGLFSVGIQEGYQPRQPIAFSHKLHAGQYEIDCNYCHTGVRLSKSANIPSANICMNCHNAIKTNSPEIQKIYAALDYTPGEGYGPNKQPIEWVRVHNLPDLAYFNHSQHVAVGNIECETCHGEIKEMEVVYQAAPLTMGWCINCHRETDVNAKGNEYYDKLVEIHAEKSSEPMRVQDIGGLECSKCHY
ncbi:c-type cytochrome [Roseivirga sp. BDSF3-8]|uniref:c-type cytochrome n=1 Tax=Roseivirga sp. BDSF3-8 TaxID=3241598 RepID=UPI0035321036